MMTHLLVYKSAKSNSVKGEFKCSIYVALEGAPKDAINNLCKDAEEATVTCKYKQNFVNILNYIYFQLLLFMFNLSKMQDINRGTAG